MFLFFRNKQGYRALVHPVSGSMFTQCLCSALEEYYDQNVHFVDIATMTNNMVARIDRESGRR